MKAVNASQYKIVLKGEVWEHSVPPCSKSAVCLLANNELVVTWLSPKDDMDNCLTHIPVILFKGKYWTLSLRMSKCIYRHIRLRKGFNNIQNVHGVQTLRIPQLLLDEKKRTQARFEVRKAILLHVVLLHCYHAPFLKHDVSTYKRFCIVIPHRKCIQRTDVRPRKQNRFTLPNTGILHL